MSRKRHNPTTGLMIPIGNKKSVGVFGQIGDGQNNVDGSIKSPASAGRHKQKLVTITAISKEAALALRNLLNKIFPSTLFEQ